jgi:hypothetical protein
MHVVGYHSFPVSLACHHAAPVGGVTGRRFFHQLCLELDDFQAQAVKFEAHCMPRVLAVKRPTHQ